MGMAQRRAQKYSAAAFCSLGGELGRGQAGATALYTQTCRTS
jgi:hypothetical protein